LSAIYGDDILKMRQQAMLTFVTNAAVVGVTMRYPPAEHVGI
jgi:hypothetical protein